MLLARHVRNDANGIEVQALQNILEAAPRYSQLAEGAMPSSVAALEMLQALPPGKDYSDKFVFTYEMAGQMAACSDIVYGYPSADTAYIGLLLVTEAHEGKGYGRQVFQHLLSVAQQRRACSRLRLGVLERNERAHQFWRNMGFAPTGEIKFHDVGRSQDKVLLYELRLAPAG